MTTANKITILRILLVPVFLVQLLYYGETGKEWHRILAMLIFLTAAITDGIDGYIARRYNQRSELGKILDPLADKLLLVLGLVFLSLNYHGHLEQLPLWLVATVLSRDVIIVIGMVVIHYTCGKVAVTPHWIGKIATVLQMVCIAWTLLKWNSTWLETWTLGAALCTGASGLYYIRDGIRQLSASPSSFPSPPPKD
ncbi:MAG TPA: CDP-diacylglycerol--glycerol-3-phosphate 3-phosphatidyltransferase [Verrucomicrobiae bacterium]|nr:CDP-diacylglycerol--glycerol-3-phosphate 3-phosphatidyltransferase [Verrucomicrobiae bacterium]